MAEAGPWNRVSTEGSAFIAWRLLHYFGSLKHPDNIKYSKGYMGKVRLIVVTVMAVLLLLPSFAAAQAKPPQGTVPSVEGMPLHKAQQTMVSAGFNAVVTMENVTDQAKNNVVLKQEVPAGKTLTKGTNVPITVGKYTAPAKVTVPKAVGFPSGSAVQMLQKQGWKVNVERKTVSEAKQNDIVLQQTPAAGTPAVPSQQVVTLTVGSYHAPAVVKGGNVKVLPKSNQTGTLNPPIEPDSVRK